MILTRAVPGCRWSGRRCGGQVGRGVWGLWRTGSDRGGRQSVWLDVVLNGRLEGCLMITSLTQWYVDLPDVDCLMITLKFQCAVLRSLNRSASGMYGCYEVRMWYSYDGNRWVTLTTDRPHYRWLHFRWPHYRWLHFNVVCRFHWNILVVPESVLKT